MTNSDWIALASAVATFLSVVVALGAFWWQANALKKQLMLQNFSDYTKRYQEIIQRFPENINEPTFSLDALDDNYTPIMRAMRMYFDLCFEEWYLNKRGFIDQRIWDIWHGGMKTALSKTAFIQAWDIVVRDTEYGTEFEQFIAGLLLKNSTPKRIDVGVSPNPVIPPVMRDRNGRFMKTRKKS